MPVSNDFRDYVLEQLHGLPRVTPRRMFGAIGLYSDGLFFAIIDDDVLYMKVDDTNRADYTTRGMRAFMPDPTRPDQSMGYYEVPAEILEDAEELVLWARRSVSVASRAPTQRKKRKRPG